MSHNILLVIITLLVIQFSNHCWAADAAKQLQGIKREIKEKKQLINKTTQVESRVSKELLLIDQSLKEKETNLSTLSKELASTDSRLQKTFLDIGSAQKDVAERKRLIQKRLVAVYKAGDVGTVRVLFSSQTFPEMLENLRYMNELLASDRQLVVAYTDRLKNLEELRRIMEEDARRKGRLKQEVELKKREVQAEKNRKASYLEQVREEKKTYVASLHELEANSRRLQSVIAQLEAARRRNAANAARKKPVMPHGSKTTKSSKTAPAVFPVSSSGFASQKGRLSLPVQGRVVGTFGRHKHPEFNSYTISNGMSIAAPNGADVRSIYGGTVVFSDYFKGYGNMVIVDHGDGFFSLYAHNAKVFKRSGSVVAKNEVLASVGDLDSTRGSLLYFEIRYQGRPINPSPWLR